LEQVNGTEGEATKEADILFRVADPDAVVPSESSADDSFGDFAGVYEAHEENLADPASQETIVKVERVEPEAEDGDDNFGGLNNVEVPKEAADAFDADWGDSENVTHSDGSAQTKGVNDAVAEFGGLTPQSAPETVGDLGDLDSFGFAPVKKEETLEDMRNSMKEMQKKLRISSSTGGRIDFGKSFETNIMCTKPSGWRLSFNQNAQKVGISNCTSISLDYLCALFSSHLFPLSRKLAQSKSNEGVVVVKS
jgi:hypothetical protein